MVDLMNEGIPGPNPGGQWSWSGILVDTVDMYGGVGGQMMAQAGPPGYEPPTEPNGPLGGGVTGPPDEWGGSSGYVGGSKSSTPPSGGSGHTPNSPNGGGRTPPVVFLENGLRQVNSGLWGVPGFGWTNKWPVNPYDVKAFPVQWRGNPPRLPPVGGGGRPGGAGGWKPGPTEKWIEDSEYARAREYNALGVPNGLMDSRPAMGEYNNVVDYAHALEYEGIVNSFNVEGLGSVGSLLVPNVIWDEMGNASVIGLNRLDLNTLMWDATP